MSQTLGEVCTEGSGVIQTGPFGSQLHASDYVPTGVPVVMPVNIGDNRIKPGGIARVREEDAQRLRRHRLRIGDIVYSRRGDVERRALVCREEEGWLCGTGCLLVRPGGHVNSAWLSYHLGTPEVRSWIVRHAVGATMPNLNTGILSAVPILVPPRDIQDAIAEMLGALDDKVHNCESLAKLAPTFAAASLQVAASQGRRIRLENIAEVRKGLSYKGGGLAVAGMPMANLANAAVFGGFKRSGWKHYTGEYKTRHVAKGGALLVANTDLTWKLEALGWPMLVPDDVDEALFSHHVSVIDFRPEWAHMRLPTWAYLFTTDARQRIEAMAHGTTVAALPAEALTGLSVPVIEGTDPALGHAKLLLARGWAAERESEKLIHLRDALLPALMSGRLRVREAEELVGEAV